jgi:hypothetical protein
MILAIALLGLSASLAGPPWELCHQTVFEVRDCVEPDGIMRTVRYSLFLGICAMLISTIGIVSLFVDRIPMIIPFVGDALGAVLSLAAGLAWALNYASLDLNCDELIYNQYILIPDKFKSLCRRLEADQGLAWALFVFTTSLFICDFFRRRDLTKSAK